MATSEYTLASPPEEPRPRELWLQHTAGFILMENVRQSAIDSLISSLSAKERAVALEAIDTTMYQLMSIIDGVSGRLRNSQYQVDLHMLVQLRERDGNQTSVLESMDLRDGDGMCMGFHGWQEGDYGDHPIVEP